jgi:hypothetical protein
MEDKKTPRQIAGKKLLAIYAKLTPSKRDLLQETLLKHAFLSAGEAYIELAHRNKCYWAAAYSGLMNVTEDAADAWYDWAAAISTESLSAGTVRQIILDFVGELYSFRFLEGFQEVHR